MGTMSTSPLWSPPDHEDHHHLPTVSISHCGHHKHFPVLASPHFGSLLILRLSLGHHKHLPTAGTVGMTSSWASTHHHELPPSRAPPHGGHHDLPPLWTPSHHRRYKQLPMDMGVAPWVCPHHGDHEHVPHGGHLPMVGAMNLPHHRPTLHHGRHKHAPTVGTTHISPWHILTMSISPWWASPHHSCHVLTLDIYPLRPP